MSENTTNENPTNEYDSPWKEALDLYFPEFLHLLYPHVYQDIDWSQGYEFLDIELQKVVRDAELGKRLADKLVKVSKNNGEPTLCFVHIEVQGQYDRHFAQRMFVYNYRIYDRYEQPVNSFAILADENPQWRPQEFGYGDWVSYMGLRFQPLKLRDYRQQKEQLMASSNPFAVFILAYLAASETKNNYQQRFQQKWILVRGLYERGYTREQILELFRLIDWVLSLPEALAQEFDQQLTNYEEEQRMPYITSIERRGMERGKEEGRQEGLERGLEEGRQEGRQEGSLQTAKEDLLEILQVRFEEVPTEYSQRLQNIDDVDFLKQLLRQAITINSLAEFGELLPYQEGS